MSTTVSIMCLLCLVGCLPAMGLAQDQVTPVRVSVPLIPGAQTDVGQIQGDRNLPRWYDPVGNLPHDIGSFAAKTVEVHSLPTSLMVVGLTMGLVASDHGMYNASRRIYESSPAVASGSDFFVSLGDGESQLIYAGLFGAYGFVASDKRALRTASQTIEALLACGIVVQTLKHIAGRESPLVATSERGTWRPLPSIHAYHEHQAKYYAFPSGHIATTMAAVTVFLANYPEATWAKPVGYSLVGLVGVGLVNVGWHWYSDLPLGIAIGGLLGRIIAQPAVHEAFSQEPKLTLVPWLNERGNGLQVALRF